MTYNDMPLIIPILASGYLLTIYLLLVLAKRSTKDLGSRVLSGSNTLHKHEVPVTPKVREITSVR